LGFRRKRSYRTCFTDSLNGWIVGGNGVIGYTNDGGLNWVEQETNLNDSYNYLRATCFIDANNGWLLLNTKNGGSDWISNSYLENYYNDDDLYLHGVFFTNGKNGYAVGRDQSLFGKINNKNRGVILSTTDGGEQWNRTVIDSASFKDVYFSDKQHGWIAGEAGVILHTKDEGENWIQQDSGTDIKLTSVHFTDNYNGWVTGSSIDCSDGVILHTSDGGNTWESKDAPSGYHINDVFFTDIDNGFIIMYKHVYNGASDGRVLYTHDGGGTWSEYEIGDYYLSSIFFIDSSTGWIVGRSIFKTENGGDTWMEQSIDIPSGFRGLFFTDINNGWVYGNSGSMYKTNNGGETWGKLKEITSIDFHDCFFTDPDNGWAVGHEGMILHTTNGGGVDIEDNNSAILTDDATLFQNYPNPFNPVTTINSGLNSGIYFYSLSVGGELKQTRKMVLIK